MRVVNWNDFVENGLDTQKPVSFTIGVFDGFHKGHEQLGNCLTSVNENLSVLATFTSNPFRLLRSDNYKGDISTVDQKLKLISAHGIEVVILIDFSLEFSKLSGREFFKIIRGHLDLSHLVLGKDHKLGYKGSTSSLQAKSILEPEGIVVDIVEPLYDHGKPVSSTRIRSSVEDGDFATVDRLLGRSHEIDIKDAGFSIINNSPCLRRTDIKQVIPFSGRYAVTLGNGDKTFATKIKINEDGMEFEEKPDFQTETLTFNRYLQE